VFQDETEGRPRSPPATVPPHAPRRPSKRSSGATHRPGTTNLPTNARSDAVHAREPRPQPSAFPPTNIRALFHPLTRVLFNFPSGYLSAIGAPHVFSLGSTYPPTVRATVPGCTTRSEASTRRNPRDRGSCQGGGISMALNLPSLKNGAPPLPPAGTALTTPNELDSSAGCVRFVRHYSGHLV